MARLWCDHDRHERRSHDSLKVTELTSLILARGGHPKGKKQALRDQVRRLAPMSVEQMVAATELARREDAVDGSLGMTMAEAAAAAEEGATVGEESAMDVDDEGGEEEGEEEDEHVDEEPLPPPIDHSEFSNASTDEGSGEDDEGFEMD